MISRRLRATHFSFGVGWIGKCSLIDLCFNMFLYPCLSKYQKNSGPLVVVNLFFVGGLVGEALRNPSKHIT